jgi:LmbE family N-acetylglucosaminyl deacetylase
MQPALKLMCVLAHPDDESIALGGTLAKYSHEGIEISLVMATRGERGWFSDWREYPGEKALGCVREQELLQASSILGVSHISFLNYTDGDVDQANEVEITAQIVRQLRLIRPHVVVTFGPEGLYGHPDHIAISQFTTSAVMCAANHNYPYHTDLEPHCVTKLYFRIAPQEWFDRYMPIFGDIVMLIDGKERRPPSLMDWIITTRVNTSEYCQQVWQAICCHQTQIPIKNILQGVSEDVHQQLWGSQEYYRAFSLVNGGRREEHDLFEGLRVSATDNHISSVDFSITPISVEYTTSGS